MTGDLGDAAARLLIALGAVLAVAVLLMLIPPRDPPGAA